MSNLPDKREEYNPAEAPVETLELASRAKSIAEIIEKNQDLTRSQARALVRHVTDERELDEEAFLPTSAGHVSKKIDLGLNWEVDRILDENRTLIEITKLEPGRMVVIDGESVPTTPESARERLEANARHLMGIKKTLSDSQKATGDANTNIQINLGDIVTQSLDNLRNMGLTD